MWPIKSCILGLTAIVFATAGASASLTKRNENAYIWVKYLNNSKFTCVDSEFNCNNITGVYPCRISVILDLPASTEVVNAHNGDICGSVVLKGNSLIPYTYDPVAIIIDVQE
jgi:hypothetical protein